MNPSRTLRIVASAALIAGAAPFAFAQPVESLSLTIEWAKPTILFGESNTAKVHATLGPDIGSGTKWNTPPGTGQPGVLKAFASTILDLPNLQNGQKGTLAWKMNPEFWEGVVEPIPPKPDGNGGLKDFNLGQFGPPLNPTPNTNQSVWLFDLTWTADQGATAPFMVEYATKLVTAKVYLDVGLSNWVGENAAKIDGQGGFIVIPAPSILAMAALPAMCLLQRRVRATRPGSPAGAERAESACRELANRA